MSATTSGRSVECSRRLASTPRNPLIDPHEEVLRVLHFDFGIHALAVVVALDVSSEVGKVVEADLPEWGCRGGRLGRLLMWGFTLVTVRIPMPDLR